MSTYDELLRALTAERFGTSTHRPARGPYGSGSRAPEDAAAGIQSERQDARRGGLSTGKLLVRVDEAAELLDVGRTRVYDLIKSGALQSVKVGGSRRIPTAALRQYVEQLLNDSL